MNENSPRNCCPGLQGFIGFLVAGLIAGLGFWAGANLTGHDQTTAGLSITPDMINASASATSDQFSIATGSVSSEAEGLFVLDHETGLLQCYVLYPRTSKFGAKFQTNIREALPSVQGQKGAKYLMVTGGAALRSGRGNVTPAGTVVYVLDAVSGNFVCYGMTFNRSAVNAGQPQTGVLIPLETGQARQLAVRE